MRRRQDTLNWHRLPAQRGFGTVVGCHTGGTTIQYVNVQFDDQSTIVEGFPAADSELIIENGDKADREVENRAMNRDKPGTGMGAPPYNASDIGSLIRAFKGNGGRDPVARRILESIVTDSDHGGLSAEMMKEVEEALAYKPRQGWSGSTASKL